MGRTSAVLGTLSQNTSILRSPWVVCSVTDMAGGCCVLRSWCYWRRIVVCNDVKQGREAADRVTIGKTAAGVRAKAHWPMLGVSACDGSYGPSTGLTAALWNLPALQP
jgi:hypothetical protein